MLKLRGTSGSGLGGGGSFGKSFGSSVHDILMVAKSYVITERNVRVIKLCENGINQ